MSSLTLALVGGGALALGTLAYVRHREAKLRQAKLRQANRAFLDQLRFGTTSTQGSREHMEDRHDNTVAQNFSVFTVCDGHEGADAADFVCKNFARDFLSRAPERSDLKSSLAASVLEMDGAFELEVAKGRLSPCGTTVVAAVVLKDEVVVAGTGDSRAVLSVKGRARSVVVEHSPCLPEEKERIEAMGAFIDSEGYLNGRIAVSRSVGDGHLKYGEESVPLIPHPDVGAVDLDDQTEFLVLSTDGVWLRPQTIIDIVRGSLRRSNSPQIAAEALVEAATSSPSAHDNVTVTVICFGPDAPPSLAPKTNRNSMLFGRGRKLK
ncbi:hypothetical protein BSKO_10184 [Bryopsis sp. KO-2023]|nr:hypothetical protein BSKO_10184 [Bryopsis sp. KO-2023]